MGPGSPRVTTTQSYQATGSVRAGGEGHLDAHGLATPFDATAGRLEALPGPADVLCAALSACILKNVERFSHLLPFRYESASIEVVAEREEPPPASCACATDCASSRMSLPSASSSFTRTSASSAPSRTRSQPHVS